MGRLLIKDVLHDGRRTDILLEGGVDWFIPTGVRKTLPRVRAEPDSVTVEALPPGQETIVPAEKSPVRTRPSAPGSSNLQTTIARLLSAQSENAAASMIL